MVTTAVSENQNSHANVSMQDGANWNASNVPVMCLEACQILGTKIDVDTGYSLQLSQRGLHSHSNYSCNDVYLSYLNIASSSY